MRLIDADALFRAINRIRCPQGASMGDGLAEACQAILDAPTIDAVPVVRCKDCAHWRKQDFQAGGPAGHLEYGGLCVNARFARYESDFCSYGERKDGEGL